MSGTGFIIILGNNGREKFCTKLKGGWTMKIPVHLEELIYRELGGLYSPDYIRATDNLDAGSQDLKTYLGTYFPRSFVEAYHTFTELLKSDNIKRFICQQRDVSILDLGCGTGGYTLGVVWAATEKSIR